MILEIALGVVLAAAGQTEPARLTIDDAVNIALKNAFDVRLSESNVEKARQNAKAAAGNLGPTLNVTGSYIRWDDNGPQAVTASRSRDAGSTSNASLPKDTKNMQFTVNQLIDITGAVHKGVDASKLAAKAQQEGFDAQVNATRYIVRSSYYGVLQARAMVKVQEDDLRAAQERLGKAKIHEKEGDIAHFDVLRLETDLKRSEQALLTAKSNLVLAKQALNNTLGRPIETPFEPVDVTTSIAPIDQKIEDLVQLALANRSEIRAAKLGVQALGKVRQSEERGSQPTLLLSAVHSRAIDKMPGQLESYSYGMAVVSWPLFDSNITRSRVRAARQDEEQAKIQLQQAELGITLEVQSALTRVTTAKEGLEVALKGEQLAAEALRLAQLRYDEEAGVVLDVITSQAALTAAHASVVNAGYEYRSALSALQKAVGKDDLVLSDVSKEKNTQ